MSAAYCGRFAPSPTGPLHFGSLVAAMASYLQARRHDGSWMVRMDDIDPPREVAGASEAILHSLKSHGFPLSNNVIFQSRNSDHYLTAINTLFSAGKVYACRCTRSSLRRHSQSTIDSDSSSVGGSRSVPVSNTVYPGICRDQNIPRDGNALRFIVSGSIEFTDAVQGQIKQDLESEVGDFVVQRRDGLFAYQLANVVDDDTYRITEVVRGSDLLDNTPRQISLARALGLTIPAYLHLPTVRNKEGQKLSKQTGAAAIENSRAIENLQKAWQFLGQKPEFDTESLRVTSDRCERFWEFATQHWNTATIPKVNTIAIE